MYLELLFSGTGNGGFQIVMLSRVEIFENGDVSYESCGEVKTEVFKYDAVMPPVALGSFFCTCMYIQFENATCGCRYPAMCGQSNTIQKCYM